MKALTLDPGSYDGTYKLIGEEISLDFINTVSWPATQWEHDWLHNADNFIKWAVAAGVINKQNAKKLSKQSNAALTNQMKDVYLIRKELAKILTAFAFEDKVDPVVVKKGRRLISSNS